MAFEFRLSDTSPRVGQAALSPSAVNPGGVPPVRTYTPENVGVAQGVNVAQTPFSQRPKFAQAENIQGLPARQDPPGPGISTTSVRGGQGSVGNPIGNSIEGVCNRLAKAIRQRPNTGLPTGVPGITTSNIPANTGFFSPVTDALGFTTPPAFSDFTASLASLKEGGFVRKKT